VTRGQDSAVPPSKTQGCSYRKQPAEEQFKDNFTKQTLFLPDPRRASTLKAMVDFPKNNAIFPEKHQPSG